MAIRKLFLRMLSALLLSACAGHPIQEPAIVLVNGLLIDGTGSDPIPEAVLVLRGDRIAAVGTKAYIRIPPGARIIDVAGATILPGVINAHVHYAFDEQHLQAWAEAGVTTVRDEAITASGNLENLSQWMSRRDQYNQNPANARLVSAGWMMGAPNGYGSLSVTSPEDARLKVEDEINGGVDLIKISMEDGYAGRSNLPKMDEDEIEAVISTAHERGALVSGHVTQAKYLQILVEAGVDDIAHIPYDPVTDEVWEEMVAKGIYMTPTFTVYRNYGASVDTCVANLAHFVEHGGHVALGNDYGGGPGDFELGIPMYEIEKMSESGMSPMQIIVASTKNAAHMAHLENQVGTLEAGKKADVLVVSQNPLEDLHAFRNVRMVIHNGMIIRDGNN